MPQSHDFVAAVHPDTLKSAAIACIKAGYSYFRIGITGRGDMPNVQFETEDGLAKLPVNGRRFRPLRHVRAFNPVRLSRRLYAADYASI